VALARATGVLVAGRVAVTKGGVGVTTEGAERVTSQAVRARAARRARRCLRCMG
jgi:hypothetical protein